MKTLCVSCVALLLATFTSGDPVEIVLSHCKEDTTWVDELGYGAITTSYDKCENTAGPGTHITKPNLGREGGTYLQHIVDRYETLADWTVFSQAERPTYGYHGHALGGGHLMSNAKFEDYVLAAKDRFVQPRFFVFTGVVVMGKENLFQSLRRHYGEGYLAPLPNSNLMCGQSDDWITGWMKFPTWFTEMIKQLLNKQGVLVTTVTPSELLPVFKVDVDYGVAFFTQGARFAASKEAILSRPKSYYEDLLKLMSHPDPWAGYFLEWLWFYVLQGPTSPCGFEERLLQSFHSWVQTPGRHVEIQALSSNDDGDVLLIGETEDVPLTDIVPECNRSVIFRAESLTTFAMGTAESTIASSEGDCSASRMITESTAVITNQRILNVNLPPQSDGLTLTNDGEGALFNLGAGSAGGKFVGLIVQCSGVGPIVLSGGTDIDFEESRISCPKRVGNQANNVRRTGFTTATYCNVAILAGLTVTAGGAIEFLEGCTSAVNGAYSNTVNTLTHEGADTFFVAKDVSPTSRPAFIQTWNDPTNMPVAVETADTTTSYSQNIVVYDTADGTCPTAWSADLVVDNCPPGMLCEITPSQSATNPDRCLLVYSQVFLSPSPTTAAQDDDGSDEALYGLLALLALIPLLCCCAAGWWYWTNRSVEEPPMYQQQPSVEYETRLYAVPQSAAPVATGMYSTGFEALYSGAPYLAPTPAGANFAAPYLAPTPAGANFAAPYLAPTGAGMGGVPYLAPTPAGARFAF